MGRSENEFGPQGQANARDRRIRPVTWARNVLNKQKRLTQTPDKDLNISITETQSESSEQRTLGGYYAESVDSFGNPVGHARKVEGKVFTVGGTILTVEGNNLLITLSDTPLFEGDNHDVTQREGIVLGEKQRIVWRSGSLLDGENQGRDPEVTVDLSQKLARITKADTDIRDSMDPHVDRELEDIMHGGSFMSYKPDKHGNPGPESRVSLGSYDIDDRGGRGSLYVNGKVLGYVDLLGNARTFVKDEINGTQIGERVHYWKPRMITLPADFDME